MDRQPDSDGCAQLIEACQGRKETLYYLVNEMHRERRQPGESVMWWVSVALQRIGGFSSRDVAARRAELREARRPRVAVATEPEASGQVPEASQEPDGNVDFSTEIAALAAGKRLK